MIHFRSIVDMQCNASTPKYGHTLIYNITLEIKYLRYLNIYKNKNKIKISITFYLNSHLNLSTNSNFLSTFHPSYLSHYVAKK